MKVRSQRTHYMGASNRDAEAFNNSSNYKTQSVFQRSFNKSKSLYSHPLVQTMSGISQKVSETRVNPFLGTHNQFESQRFDKMNVKPYKQRKMNFPTGRRTITFAPILNNQVKNLQDQFKDKKINMHKLNELKRSFIKNNRDRRNLQQYFEKYASQGLIDANGLSKIVKEYGFDINQDQAKLIFKLTQKSLKSQTQSNLLNIEGFIELMTKDDIYYQTLQLGQGKSESEIISEKTFSQKVHEVLRNKFPSLKEAFKIYRQRNEEIGLKQFEYVMKKLDLTDLVLTQQERNNIYKQFADQKGLFNVEGLVCAIAEQEHLNKYSKRNPNDFNKDLDANKEISFANSVKSRHFNMKTMSSLEYENQFQKARVIIEELNRIKKEKKQNKQNEDIFKDAMQGNFATRQEVIKNTQKIMRKEGLNFHKEDYEAFAAYLNYDVNGCISLHKINHEVFKQSEKEARDRIERRVRNEAPIKANNSSTFSDHDRDAAISSITKIKSHKMNPQTRELFKFLDEDQDGFISAHQFKQKLDSLKIMENWEIQNLANYFGANQKGSITFNDFSKGINEDLKKLQAQLPLVRNNTSKSCYNWNETTRNKNSLIKTFNQIDHKIPTKFSAWPQNITTQDLSLLQPPHRAGMYASENDRFNQRKQDYAAKEKAIVMGIAESRRRKIAEWNNILQQRSEVAKQKQQQKAAAKNYSLRLAQEKYEFNCHQ